MTLTQLARELTVDKATVSRWRAEPWFPQPDARGRYDVPAIRRLAAANGKRVAGAGAPAPGSAILGVDPSHPDVVTLRSDTATPAQIRDATLHILARHFADAAVAGKFGSKDADGISRSLEELRRGEQADFELAIKRGEYIPRDTAKAMSGALALKLVSILNNLENTLAAQVEQWQVDPEFLALGTDARRLRVRGWIEAQGRALRAVGADELEALIRSEESESAP